MKKTITAVKALRTGYGAVQSENVEFSTKGEKRSDEDLKYGKERYILTAKIHVGLLRLDRAIPVQETPVLSAKENSAPTLV